MKLPDFSITEWFFVIFLVFLIIEQIFYRFLGSYPYAYGIPLRYISIRSINDVVKKLELRNHRKLKTKKSRYSNSYFLRYKYPFGTVGPLVFIGEIDLGSEKLIIKVGPATSLAIAGMLTGLFYIRSSTPLIEVFNYLIILCLIYFLYRLLMNAIKKDLSIG
jgi:hypothetical protein